MFQARVHNTRVLLTVEQVPEGTECYRLTPTAGGTEDAPAFEFVGPVVAEFGTSSMGGDRSGLLTITDLSNPTRPTLNFQQPARNLPPGTLFLRLDQEEPAELETF